MRPVKMGKNGKTPTAPAGAGSGRRLGVILRLWTKKSRRIERREEEEVYLHGELDRGLGGVLIDWGATAFGGRLWLKFRMPDGHVVTIYTNR